MGSKYERMTPRQYLVRERRAEYKSEYYAGEVVAMAGASVQHARIVANLSTTIGAQLGGGRCEHFIADLRVWVEDASFYLYPDLVVVCGAARVEQKDNLLNPTVVVEVLSPSTERDDRGRKAAAYKALPSLLEYVLVAQEQMRVELYRRENGGKWGCTLLQRPEDVLRLESVGCAVRLGDLYRRVVPPLEFETTEAPEPVPVKYRLER